MGALAGLVAIITGGAGGLGAVMAQHFAGEGARVVVADRDLAQAEVVAAGIGPAAHAFALDVASEKAWEALFVWAEEELGKVDILVNAAGIYRPNIAFEDMPLSLWRLHMAINCDGVFLGCKHAILHMKGRGGGAILNIGSGMSITANPMGAAYCASKAAVLMTTKSAAKAAGRYGIRVNALLPGAVPTPMLMGNVQPGDSDAAFLARMDAGSVLGRMADAGDIARAALFLCDPANKAITGVHLPVDGGNLPGA